MENKLEDKYYKEGYKLICGCDEAGRGPLIGSVFAAACILPKNHGILGINDSKKLSEKRREYLYQQIKEKAISYCVVEVDVETIDKINILEASRLGMINALKGLSVKPDFIITDYMNISSYTTNFISPAHADALSENVAAASILAKVERDRYMKKLSDEYPLYELDKNKGYPTASHMQAILKYGITPLHRKSYKPVKEYLETHTK